MLQTKITSHTAETAFYGFEEISFTSASSGWFNIFLQGSLVD